MWERDKRDGEEFSFEKRRIIIVTISASTCGVFPSRDTSNRSGRGGGVVWGGRMDRVVLGSAGGAGAVFTLGPSWAAFGRQGGQERRLVSNAEKSPLCRFICSAETVIAATLVYLSLISLRSMFFVRRDGVHIAVVVESDSFSDGFFSRCCWRTIDSLVRLGWSFWVLKRGGRVRPSTLGVCGIEVCGRGGGGG